VPDTLSPALAGLGLGIALAGAPGPVQAVLLAEALRGGTRRGLRAMAGANLTFGALLLALALGISVTTPSETAITVLKLVGGAMLIVLGVDGLRNWRHPLQPQHDARAIPAAAKGSLAVVLNPGVWIFLATVVTSLVATATSAGGTPAAILAVLALLLGVGLGDGTLVVLGGSGIRKSATPAVGRWLQRGLALTLVLLGAGLIASLIPRA
jgi:threonine/homoserine/homoserine lactone efflux protein